MADDEEYTFDEGGAKRVVNAVRFVETISQGDGLGTTRRDGLINSRPRLLVGSLVERLGGARHRYALFNVMQYYPHGGPDGDPVHGRIPVNFRPLQIYVWDFSRWNTLGSATLTPNDDGYGPGTNGSAHWVDNFGCYLFVPDCGTVIPAEYEPDPSSPSEPAFEEGWYCLEDTNEPPDPSSPACTYLTGEGDIPSGWVILSGPHPGTSDCGACTEL